MRGVQVKVLGSSVSVFFKGGWCLRLEARVRSVLHFASWDWGVASGSV